MPPLPLPTLFWKDNHEGFPPGLYVSPNSTFFPDYHKGNSWHWEHYYTQLWRENNLGFYWTALSPRRQIFDGFLSPLNEIIVQSIETPRGVKFRLAPECLARWVKIEELLRRVARVMNHECYTRLDLETDSNVVRWPSDKYKYDGLYSSRKEAMSHLKTARAIFMLKVTQLTFMNFLHAKTASNEPRWTTFLSWTTVITPEELELVRGCMICTNTIDGCSIERVGLMVDARTRFSQDVTREMDKLVKAFDLPVWILYGVDAQAPFVHMWATFKLDPDVIRLRLRQSPAVNGVRTLVQTVPSASEPEVVQENRAQQPDHTEGWQGVVKYPTFDRTAPRPNPQTRQLPGQTWKEFLDAMDNAMVAAYATATPEQTRLWDQRVKTHENRECPNRSHKAQVFLWEEDHEGNYVRQLVGRNRWRTVFEESAFSQRHYDPVRNEFDICSALDPDAEISEDIVYISGAAATGYAMYIDDSEDQTGGPSQPDARGPTTSVTELAHRSPSPTGRRTSARHQSPYRTVSHSLYRRRSHSPAPRRDRQNSSQPSAVTSVPPRPRSPLPRRTEGHRALGQQPRHETIPDDSAYQVKRPVLDDRRLRVVLAQRYGLLSIPTDFRLPAALHAKHDSLSKDRKFTSILGHWSEQLPEVLKEHAKAYFAFLIFTPGEGELELRPPSPLSDTAVGNPACWPYKQDYRLVEVEASSSAIVETVQPDGVPSYKIWYLVRPAVPAQRDVDYQILVNDPLTVNQILRVGLGSSTYQIASFLIERGLPFKTIRRYSGPPSLMWPAPPMPMFTSRTPLGLGVRHNTKEPFTVADYEKYIEQRDQVLFGYFGRAAYLAGGIVWRLAMDAMSDQALTLHGPIDMPTRQNYLEFKGRGYVSDVLTEHAEDVICGVYRVTSDAHKAEHRTPFMSWWPSSSVWRDSGMNVGYWTPSNEHWFCTRRDKILAGQEQPKHAAHWKEALRHQRPDTRRMLAVSRELAAKSLPSPT